MFVGSFLTMTAYYYVYIAKVECHITPLNITVAGIMYVSYVILFAKFFAQAYLSNKSAKNVKGKTDANSKLKANWNAYKVLHCFLFFVYKLIFPKWNFLMKLSYISFD